MTPDARIPVKRLEMIINMPFVSIYEYDRERVGMEEIGMEEDRNCR